MNKSAAFSTLLFMVTSVSAFLPQELQATTVSVIDANGFTLGTNTSPIYCPRGRTGGSVICLNSWGGEGTFLSPQDSLGEEGRLAFITADISSLSSVNFDHVYLAVTEIRTLESMTGTASVYAANNQIPLDLADYVGGDVTPYLTGIDQALAAGTTFAGELTGTGIGGNHLLLDITSIVESSLSNGISLLGLLLKDEIEDGLYLGLLGSNYDSGLPSCTENVEPCQYYATSPSEFPTLIATVNPVPIPAAFWLFGSGLLGLIGLARRKTHS